jgi:hypothetical protein
MTIVGPKRPSNAPRKNLTARQLEKLFVAALATAIMPQPSIMQGMARLGPKYRTRKEPSSVKPVKVALCVERMALY